MKMNLKALSTSTWLTVILIAILTVSGELSSSFKSLMASITGHHWSSKGVIGTVFFILVYLILAKLQKDDFDALKESKIITTVTLISSLIIFLFFLQHFLS